MNSRTLAEGRAELSVPSRLATRGASLGAAAYLPGSDVLLVFAGVGLALSVFELAAWLASAPLTILIYSVVLVPVALFLASVLASVVSERR